MNKFITLPINRIPYIAIKHKANKINFIFSDQNRFTKFQNKETQILFLNIVRIYSWKMIIRISFMSSAFLEIKIMIKI